MKIDHITLLFSSFKASNSYYEVLLPLVGFRRHSREIWTDDEGFFFQFREAQEGARPYERYGAGLNHLGFAAKSPEQVVSIRQAMLDSGFDVPDIQELDGIVALFMKDPDGIRFEISYCPSGVSIVG